jgi:hypothetical protein
VTRKTGVSFDTVRRLGKALPDVVDAMSYGTAALKVKKALMVRLKEDGETLVVRCDMVSRDLMLKAEPTLFFITDHYRDYPAILVRLSRVSEPRLRELLEDAWQFVTTPRAAPRSGRAPRRGAPGPTTRPTRSE